MCYYFQSIETKKSELEVVDYKKRRKKKKKRRRKKKNSQDHPGKGKEDERQGRSQQKGLKKKMQGIRRPWRR